MSFDAASTVNGIVDYICNSKFTYTVVSNPLIMALLLTVIIITIILGFLYHRLSGEHFTTFIKIFVYSFISAVVLLLLHYKCQERTIEKVYSDEQGLRIFSSTPTTIDEKKIGGTIDEEDCGCDKVNSLNNSSTVDKLVDKTMSELQITSKKQPVSTIVPSAKSPFDLMSS
jgi:hypothetical protein